MRTHYRIKRIVNMLFVCINFNFMVDIFARISSCADENVRENRAWNLIKLSRVTFFERSSARVVGLRHNDSNTKISMYRALAFFSIPMVPNLGQQFSEIAVALTCSTWDASAACYVSPATSISPTVLCEIKLTNLLHHPFFATPV